MKRPAHLFYGARRTIHNPYLDCEVVLNSDGFHHLQLSARRERDKKEQLLKLMKPKGAANGVVTLDYTLICRFSSWSLPLVRVPSGSRGGLISSARLETLE